MSQRCQTRKSVLTPIAHDDFAGVRARWIRNSMPSRQSAAIHARPSSWRAGASPHRWPLRRLAVSHDCPPGSLECRTRYVDRHSRSASGSSSHFCREALNCGMTPYLISDCCIRSLPCARPVATKSLHLNQDLSNFLGHRKRGESKWDFESRNVAYGIFRETPKKRAR
jgi:hypothetical protein